MQLFQVYFDPFLFRHCKGSSIAYTAHMDTQDARELCAFDKLFKRNVPNILERIFLSLDLDSHFCCLEVNKSWKVLLTSKAFRKKGKTTFLEELRFLYRVAIKAVSS